MKTNIQMHIFFKFAIVVAIIAVLLIVVLLVFFKMGYYCDPNWISTDNVNVGSDYVEYQGNITGNSSLVFTGYSYKIDNGTLYIVPRANLPSMFADTGNINIKLTDKNVTNIKKIVLGKEDDKSKEVIWQR